MCFAAAPALAFPSTRLVYVRAKGTERCPDESVVRVEVTQRLGYDPFFLWAERTIVVRINRDGKALQALIELLDAKGNVQGARRLRETTDCEELVRSIALAISIGLDPEASTPTPLERRDADRELPAPATSAAVSPPPPAPSAAAAMPTASKAARAELPARAAYALEVVTNGGVFTGVGWAPRVVVGASVALGAAMGPLSVSLEGRAHLPGSRGGVQVDVLTASVVPCVASGIVFGCGLGIGGRIHANGSRHESARFLGIGARVGVRWPVFRRTWARVFVDGVVPSDRTTVAASGLPVWQLPPVTGSLSIDVESHLW
jgi:hypothetical protein